MKVLVVDDSKAIAVTVKEMLEMAGHQVKHAINGAQAKELLKSESYDLVLLDWNMPEKTGIELLEENFKEKFCSAPIIMMTTENKPDYIMKALGLGACEYIMKPFTSDILISKIESIVG